MDRVVNYVTHFGLSAFWIDQECIDQQDSRAKERAMQSMDLVYRCSKYPLGVLTKPLRQKMQLKLLHQMLLNEFVVMGNSRPQLACQVVESPKATESSGLFDVRSLVEKALDIPGRIL
jgi:Heterokaryon incompatibility protein (HET)